MAYLTISNSIQILKQIDEKQFQHQEGTIYKKPIFFFGEYEKNILLGLQELWKDPENFIANYYNPIKVEDKLKYVFEGTHPAYHLDASCPRLNSNFKNFEIPQEIKNKGASEVLKFRKWFKANMHLMEKPKIFTMKLFHAFNIQINPRAIDYENSGIEEKENLNLSQLEERIDSLLRDASNFWRENPNKQGVIRRFQKYTFLGYRLEEIYNNDTGLSDIELKEFLREYDAKFKKPIKDLLIEYYRVKLNPDLKFEGKLLEQLGFRPCGTCYGNMGNEIYQELPDTSNEMIVIGTWSIATVKQQIGLDTIKLVNCGHDKFVVMTKVDGSSTKVSCSKDMTTTDLPNSRLIKFKDGRYVLVREDELDNQYIILSEDLPTPQEQKEILNKLNW